MTTNTPDCLAAALLLERAPLLASTDPTDTARSQRLRMAVVEVLAACRELLEQETAALPPPAPDLAAKILREAVQKGFRPAE